MKQFTLKEEEDCVWRIWQMKDAVTTVVEANGLSVWSLSCNDNVLRLELSTHLEEETMNELCSQFPVSADYSGEGYHGTIISLNI